MARKTIVKEAVAAVRTVAGAALDAAAEEARRVVADTAVRGAGKGAGKKKNTQGASGGEDNFARQDVSQERCDAAEAPLTSPSDHERTPSRRPLPFQRLR